MYERLLCAGNDRKHDGAERLLLDQHRKPEADRDDGRRCGRRRWPNERLKKAFGEGPVSGVVAQLFAAEFMDTPAKNYIELVYNTPEMGNFTVTIQKHDHKTPGQRIAEVEDEREVLLAQLKDTVAAYEKCDDVFGGIERARQLIAKLEAK